MSWAPWITALGFCRSLQIFPGFCPPGFYLPGFYPSFCIDIVVKRACTASLAITLFAKLLPQGNQSGVTAVVHHPQYCPCPYCHPLVKIWPEWVHRCERCGVFAWSRFHSLRFLQRKVISPWSGVPFTKILKPVLCFKSKNYS